MVVQRTGSKRLRLDRESDLDAVLLFAFAEKRNHDFWAVVDCENDILYASLWSEARFTSECKVANGIQCISSLSDTAVTGTLVAHLYECLDLMKDHRLQADGTESQHQHPQARQRCIIKARCSSATLQEDASP